ncbi:hypothetical protein CONPUDRAFT_154347 [Coniophora puteana RWD-64-598 SS2]|uniref:Uncharacterized protein n=1 Tax=Coniophora puteana (strain RWD-64-598) TaxID=741705 RepID=A0A5M3MM95_CONPW|nr:uncharacterized protein CONPUDRAFT_154347 [Coniophora puteana RWD-64-598 SS2]EIW80309.1 hypothetical protein CONPUDRAFT_154347 [Coniophora puteana RWD-64-598 SS2]
MFFLLEFVSVTSELTFGITIMLPIAQQYAVIQAKLWRTQPVENIFFPTSAGTVEAAAVRFLTDQVYHADDILRLAYGTSSLKYFLTSHGISHNVYAPLTTRWWAREDDESVEGSFALTDSADVMLLHTFSAHGFIGRTFTHALDEMHTMLHYNTPHSYFKWTTSAEARVANTLSLTVSSLFLDYSAALESANITLPALRALKHQQEIIAASPASSSNKGHLLKKLSDKIKNRFPFGVSQSADQNDFKEGLEVIIGNMDNLASYLGWAVDYLVDGRAF